LDVVREQGGGGGGGGNAARMHLKSESILNPGRDY
jgi:hypothetical protein